MAAGETTSGLCGRFRPRCPFAQEKCFEEPPLREIKPGQFSACHFAETLPEHTGARGA